MASFTAPTPVSVNELIAQAMSTMTALWDEIGTSDSDRDAVKKDLKVKLSRCVAEVEQNETLIRDGKLSEIKQSLDQYNKKGTPVRCSLSLSLVFIVVVSLFCFPLFPLFPVVSRCSCSPLFPVFLLFLSPMLTQCPPLPMYPPVTCMRMSGNRRARRYASVTACTVV